MIGVTTSGSFTKTENSLKRMLTGEIYRNLSKYGEKGVAALREATPKDSGVTADSWEYQIVKRGTRWEITWYNTNTVSGVPVAILLQYGHGTGTGGYVRGRDYINPAIKPIFDEIEQAVWEEVTRS